MDKKKARILIVDDVTANVTLIARLLADYDCITAGSGPEALDKISRFWPDLILLDVVMPGMDGFEVCRLIKSNPAYLEIPVVMVTSLNDRTSRIRGLEVGANEFLTKPIDPAELRIRTANLLKVKEYGDFLSHHNQILEEKLAERTHELQAAYGEVIARLATAAEYKDKDTGFHILRISKYTRALARVAGLTEAEQSLFSQASPMHDVGKIGIPDHILLKPGPLDAEETLVMQSHTSLGGKILAGSESALLKVAQLIAVSHHERWDGSGYPQGLAKQSIPLAARIVAIADQYDALRSPRPYKPSLTHASVVEIMSRGDGRTCPDHFDPDLLNFFIVNHLAFEQIFAQFNE